jgi:hypothetical protein
MVVSVWRVPGALLLVCVRVCACVCVLRMCVRACLWCSSTMFELLRRQKLDLLGSYYADNVNDGMRGNVRVPSPCSCTPPRAMSCDDVESLASGPGGSGALLRNPGVWFMGMAGRCCLLTRHCCARPHAVPCNRTSFPLLLPRVCVTLGGGCAMYTQQTPSCDGMGPGNNRHVGDGKYCQSEDNLSAAAKAATLGV